MKPSVTGAVSTAPKSSSAHSPKRRYVLFLRVTALGAVLAIAAWGILHGPWYTERHYAHMTLAELLRERGKATNDPAEPENPVLLYYLGKQLNQQNRFAEADPILRKAVGLDPEEARFRDEWTKALLGSGLTTAAFGQLQQFAGTHPKSAPAHFLLGKFYFTQRSMRRASEEFEQAVTLDADYGEGWAYLAAARQALGELEPARKACARAVQLRPNNAEDRLLNAALLAAASQPDAARQEFIRAVELSPDIATTHREYARWLLDSGGRPGDVVTAEKEAARAMSLDANDGVACRIYGRALLAQSRAQEALAPLLRAAELDPYDPAPALSLREAYQQIGNADKTAEWNATYTRRQKDEAEYQRLFDALRVDPNSTKLHQEFAKLLCGRGEVDGCIRNWAAVKKCALDAPPALIAAANDLTDAGFARDAQPLAERALAVAVHNPEAHQAMGNVLLAQDEIVRASEEYVKTTQWLPERKKSLTERYQKHLKERAAHPPPAELVYRDAQQKLKDRFRVGVPPNEVLTLAQKAVDMQPRYPAYLAFLMRVQMSRREYDAALETGRRLLALVPDDAPAHVLVASLLADKALTPEIQAEVDAHLQQSNGYPGNEATWRYAYGLLALRRGKADIAVRELRRAALLDPKSALVYEKLALAEQASGHTQAAEKALGDAKRRETQRQEETNAVERIVQNPQDSRAYAEAATLLTQHGLVKEAQRVRAESLRITAKSSALPPTGRGVPAP